MHHTSFPVKAIWKIVLLLFCLFCSVIIATAQSVGIGTTTPSASAQLDITSSDKGLLIPRMTTGAINSISGPSKGLLVLDTTLNQLKFNMGTPAAPNWQTIVANSGWGLTGNAGTSPATHFIGTTDNQNVVVKRNNERAGLLGEPITANTSWGVGALNTASPGTFNTANGFQSLYSNTDGESNTANGAYSLNKNTTGYYNTANGTGSLSANTTGYYNTANGTGSLSANTTGYYNTTNGVHTLFDNTTGNSNVAVGVFALYSNITGNNNVGIGVSALFSNTDRSNLVAIGDSALYNNGVGATLAQHATANSAAGNKALYSNTTGYENTAFGANALKLNISGAFNTANGVQAAGSNTTGSSNTANGAYALRANTTGSFNTAAGTDALQANITGSNNTANGVGALYFNSSGQSNVAVGVNALFKNTTRSNLVAVGDSALYNNGFGVTSSLDATGNTAIGSKALYSNNIGSNNTANGFQALSSNTSGSDNAALGNKALYSNFTGQRNIALGVAAGNTNNGDNNVFIGHNAGFSNNGSRNVFIGYSAGASATSESNRLYIDNSNVSAAEPLIYGEFDTKKLQVNSRLGIGAPASTNFPLGVKGINNGGNDDLLMFYNSASISKWHINILASGALNFVETGVADFRLVLQSGAGGKTGIGRVPTTNRLEVEGEASKTTSGSWLANSDSRLKKNITQLNGEEVLEKLLQLKGITYEWNDDKTGYKRPTGIQYGFTAQNIQAVFPNNVQTDGAGYLQTAYGNYDPMFIEALRVLNSKIKLLEEKDKTIATQEERIAKLEALVKQIMEKKE